MVIVENLWSAEENCILLFFVSRGIGNNAILELLARRGYQRTLPGIANKIAWYRRNYPRLLMGEKWNWRAVDRFMDRQLDHDSVNALIHLTPEDSEIVIKVSILFNSLIKSNMWIAS